MSTINSSTTTAGQYINRVIPRLQVADLGEGGNDAAARAHSAPERCPGEIDWGGKEAIGHDEIVIAEDLPLSLVLCGVRVGGSCISTLVKHHRWRQRSTAKEGRYKR